MKHTRGGTVFSVAFVALLACAGAAWGQAVVDTMHLTPMPPESIYVRPEGRAIVIGWYPPPDSVGSVVGSRDFTEWYVTPSVSHVDLVGFYAGDIDRRLRVEKFVMLRDTIGQEPSIRMLAQVEDRRDVYRLVFDIGSSHYAAGDTIRLVLAGQATGDTLDLGIGLVFGPGVIEIGTNFEIDLQTLEGFHIWRGLEPYPTDMVVISELSRADAFIGIEEDSLYFLEWPKVDEQGRRYYEFIDDNAYVGFYYYYIVTCFDQGYFKGFTEHNKEDNFICDEDLSNPQDSLNPVDCSTVAKRIYLTVKAGSDVTKIYAVPNPFRTGTSADTSPFYHNYPDESIRFYNIPEDSELQIFTVSGDLVRELNSNGYGPANGVITWDTKNKHGQKVGSGVYIYRVKANDGNDMYGRVVVIR